MFESIDGEDHSSCNYSDSAQITTTLKNRRDHKLYSKLNEREDSIPLKDNKNDKREKDHKDQKEVHNSLCQYDDENAGEDKIEDDLAFDFKGYATQIMTRYSDV